MLKLRRVAIDTNRENVAFLRRDCSLYRAESFQALSKIEVIPDDDGERKIFATLNIVDDEKLLDINELGLCEQAFEQFGLDEGAPIHIFQAMAPHSLESVREKIRGQTLSATQIEGIIEDIAARRYSRMEIAAFLISSANFLSTSEILSLTRAMADVGTRLEWDEQPVVDKHCIGGIPGNRTSMIVVPIVAAHGLMMPKTSSRAITSPAGTADTMEVLANVDLSFKDMRTLVKKERGCLVWGGMWIFLRPMTFLFLWSGL